MLQQNFGELYLFVVLVRFVMTHIKIEILDILDIHKLEVGWFVYKFFHILTHCFNESLSRVLQSTSAEPESSTISINTIMKKVTNPL